jgi:hypothetical protein
LARQWLEHDFSSASVLGFWAMLLSLVYASWKPQTAPLAESRGERGET